MTLTGRPTVIDLTPFRADLAQALAKRGKRLLESNDLAAEVAELSALESYYVIKGLGADSALPILSCLSDDQFSLLIDIDCWFDQRPAFLDIDAWLAVFRSEGLPALAAAFLRLDEELQTLLLQSMLTVWDPHLDDIPEPARQARRRNTPDEHFVVEADDSVDWEVDPLELVEALYRFDVGEGLRQLLTARSELPSHLEELALRFRNGRLEDWGFPSKQRALRVLSPPEPQRDLQWRNVSPLMSLPAPYAAPLTERALFVQAANCIMDEERRAGLLDELVLLVNTAAVAYGARLRNIEDISSAAARVRDTVSLGLDARAGDRADRVLAATQYLETESLETLFREGHQQLHILGSKARELVRDAQVREWLELDDPDGSETMEERAERAFLAALGADVPAYAGFNRQRPHQKRGVSSVEELRTLEDRLQRLSERFR